MPYKDKEKRREYTRNYMKRWREEHRDYIRKYDREYRRKYKEKGICPTCGRSLDYSISVHRCPVCHFKRLDSQNKIRVDRLSKGLCVDCGKRPLYTKWFCFECNERHLSYYRLPDVSGDLERARVFVEGLE